MAHNGMLSPEQLRRYHDEGYVILDDFCGASETDALRARIDVFDDELNKQLLATGGQFNQIPNQIVFTCNLNFRDVAIQSFIAQKKMVNLTTQLLGPDVRLYWDQSVYSCARAAWRHSSPHCFIAAVPT